MTEDPYKVLGVSPSASDEEIQKAYRKLVKKYHPDVNPGDENAERKMREINAAYDHTAIQAAHRPPADITETMADSHGRIYSVRHTAVFRSSRTKPPMSLQPQETI